MKETKPSYTDLSHIFRTESGRSPLRGQSRGCPRWRVRGRETWSSCRPHWSPAGGWSWCRNTWWWPSRHILWHFQSCRGWSVRSSTNIAAAEIERGFYLNGSIGSTVSLRSHKSKPLESKDIRTDLQCMATEEYINRKQVSILFNKIIKIHFYVYISRQFRNLLIIIVGPF